MGRMFIKLMFKLRFLKQLFIPNLSMCFLFSKENAPLVLKRFHSHLSNCSPFFGRLGRSGIRCRSDGRTGLPENCLEASSTEKGIVCWWRHFMTVIFCCFPLTIVSTIYILIFKVDSFLDGVVKKNNIYRYLEIFHSHLISPLWPWWWLWGVT